MTADNPGRGTSARRAATSREARQQYGALCYRLRDGEIQFLLITSRGTGRWIIPKGWPMDGRSPEEAAAIEAYEEAGAEGRTRTGSIGLYSYTKTMEREPDFPCEVAVYPMQVKGLKKEYPEAHQRRRRWFSRKKAAACVNEPELAALIRGFEPTARKQAS
ncbi:NUDIX domain protein [Pseudoruegeria aquimaris]|uniref:NUDIX domain protein n=1 Tax=Pseudoruegeria aquimaris TaxID=393663 RepID=A0A1Y5T835_9RHOB|nr:NUDIX hydrolase [Pseudoruegeria aquimaris]SLN57711.1 NUDIX domain protein [Pseudoruegeria aquimaris]